MSQPPRETSANYAARPGATAGMWRYRDLLPGVEPIQLGEGWTPLVQSPRHPHLYLKDESRNPTGSFYDRSASLLVSQARQDGVRHVACTGPQGTAIAAYAAAAGITAHLFLPRYADSQAEAKAYGAEIHQIEDPAATPSTWRDLSTPSDPALETIGFELCEQLAWQPPKAVIAPESILPALANSFAQLQQQDWLAPGGRLPTLYPASEAEATTHNHAGILLSPEGAAGLAIYEQLLAAGQLKATDCVVLINPSRPIPAANKLPWSMPVGGIITPV